jgi:hypothetical protein
MTWFRQKETVQPAQVGLFLFAFVRDRVLSSTSTRSLRELLSEEGAPVHKRDTFDHNLFVFALFLAFIAVRRKYPAATAEKVLAGALKPLLATCGEQEAGVVRARLDRYHNLWRPSDNRDRELAALTYRAGVDLYKDEARDPLLKMSLTGWIIMTGWISRHLKMFEDFLSKMHIPDEMRGAQFPVRGVESRDPGKPARRR